MKKLLIFFITGILFANANMKLISQKIKDNSIIITFKVDSKTFKMLKKEENSLEETTKNNLCKSPQAKKLLNKYNLIYNYKSDKNIIRVEVDKGSCE